MGLADRLQGRRGRSARPQTEEQFEPSRDDGDLFESLYIEVIDRLDTRGVDHLDPNELQARVQQLVELTLRERGLSLSARKQERIIAAIADEILGLGPLEALLADPSISDILVNNSQSVFIERRGVLEETGVRFRDDAHLLNTIKRIVSQVGRRIDEGSPMVDARLPDGSRINAVIPPLAIDGPSLSIRRFAGGPADFRQLVENQALTAAMAHYFKSAVRSRCNILVCGGTGAGKTTLLNAVSRYISSRERIITIEDSAELRLQRRHVVRLETRPPNIEGQGAVTVRDLVRNALRMRPDRIIVGEVRAEEVLDMVQAMNTGHDGSMTTVHANSVADGFTRLMAMLSMASTQLSEALMRDMIARALDVVVHVVRGADGRRRISEVAEVIGVEDEQVCVNSVFVFEPGADGQGGGWRSSGKTLFAQRFASAGVPLDERVLR